MSMIYPQYLGDGVYAHFDGWGIVLTTGHHDPAQADNIVVLEPEVMTAFDGYRTALAAYCNELRKMHERAKAPAFGDLSTPDPVKQPPATSH